MAKKFAEDCQSEKLPFGEIDIRAGDTLAASLRKTVGGHTVFLCSAIPEAYVGFGWRRPVDALE